MREKEISEFLNARHPIHRDSIPRGYATVTRFYFSGLSEAL